MPNHRRPQRPVGPTRGWARGAAPASDPADRAQDRRSRAWLVGLASLAAIGLASAADPTAPTPTAGADECRPGATLPGCLARPFTRTDDLAWAGNGYAKAAVVRDNLGPAMHNAANANDGYYGNGSAWIGATAGSWVKIDLGRAAVIDGVRFGRDRTGSFDDRDPGAFSVFVAATDVYATGNEANDTAEYIKVYDSATQGFNGVIAGSATVAASFGRVNARYVKVVFANAGAAIDEVEVSGVPAMSWSYPAVAVGAPECRGGAAAPACDAQPFDRAADLAWTGNGALPAVTKDTINSPLHAASYLNDGAYGNGSTWIGATAGSWAKVDLGKTAKVSSVRFGRDRTGRFDDRDPGQFEIYAALSDAVYATGNDSNDATEYTRVFASSFSGTVNGPNSVVAEFPTVDARFIKVVWTSAGAAIDEVEVMNAPSSRPDTNLALRGPVAQSTIVFDAVPDRANDGIRDGAWSHGTVTHTQSLAGQWLELGLGGRRIVDDVLISNRTDCCGERLTGVTVQLTLTPCDAATPSVVASQVVPATGALARLSFPDGPIATFVCLRNAGTNPLSVAEVEVMGPPPIPADVPFEACESAPGPAEPSPTATQPAPAAAVSNLVVDTTRLWNPGKVLHVCYLHGLDMRPDGICGISSEAEALNTPSTYGKQLAGLGGLIKENVHDYTSAEDFDFIEDQAMKWTRYANIKFEFQGLCQPGVGSEIVISTDAADHGGGYWVPALGGPNAPPCTAGQDCPPNLLMQQRAEETAIHEFGHALGLLHEQQNPRIAWNYNNDALLAAGEDPAQWALATGSIVASTFDPYSIMLYRVPYKYIQGGKAAWKAMYPDYDLDRCNTGLSADDKANIAKIYPFNGPRDLAFGSTAGDVVFVRYSPPRSSSFPYSYGEEIGAPATFPSLRVSLQSSERLALAPSWWSTPWTLQPNGDVRAALDGSSLGNLGVPGFRDVSRSGFGDTALVLAADSSVVQVTQSGTSFASNGVVIPAGREPLRGLCGGRATLYTLDLAGKITRYRNSGGAWTLDPAFTAQQPGASAIACDDQRLFVQSFDGTVRFLDANDTKPWRTITALTGVRNLAAADGGFVAIYDPPTATLYADRDYGSTARPLTNSVAQLSTISFNDTASSLKVGGSPAIASVYIDANYSGSCRTFTANTPSIADAGWNNDAASSVRLGTPCAYTVDRGQGGVFYDAIGGTCPSGGVIVGGRCKVLSSSILTGNLWNYREAEVALDPATCEAQGGVIRSTMINNIPRPPTCRIVLP